MKKLFIIFSLLILSFSTQAFEKMRECQSTLTRNFSVDSRSFSMDLDQYDIRDYGKDHVAFSIRLVRELLNDLGCSPNSVNFGQGALGRSTQSCRQLVPGREISRVCYIETNLGAFILTVDYFTEVHIVFKRWD